MSKRSLKMLILGVVVLAPLVAVFIWVRSRPQGRAWIDVPPVNSKGFIAAMQEMDSGSTRLVSISPDGTIREPKGSGETSDTDFTWQSEGRRIIFAGNRASDGSEQLFSWMPDRDAEPFQETPSGTVRMSPWFFAKESEILFCARGDVWALTWPNGKLRPVMPPAGREMSIGGEEGEMIEQTQGVTEQDRWISQGWSSLSGTLEAEGFESARLFGGGKYFAGICRTAQGPALVIANLDPKDQAQAIPIAPDGGELLEISTVDDKPLLVVAVKNFRYPIPSQVPQAKRRPNGKLIADYVNALLVFDMEKGSKVAPFMLDKGKVALMQPALSPKGDEIAVCVNVFEKESWISKALIVVPIEHGAFNSGKVSTLLEGEVYDPSWNADGTQLTYIKGGDVFVINRDGSGEKNLTNGKGKFRKPQFSPQ